MSLQHHHGPCEIQLLLHVPALVPKPQVSRLRRWHIRGRLGSGFHLCLSFPVHSHDKILGAGGNGYLFGSEADIRNERGPELPQRYCLTLHAYYASHQTSDEASCQSIRMLHFPSWRIVSDLSGSFGLGGCLAKVFSRTSTLFSGLYRIKTLLAVDPTDTTCKSSSNMYTHV